MDCCSSLEHVDAAVLAANKAFLPWARLPQKERIEFVKKLGALFKQREQEIAQCIARETGKPLWESLTEAKGLVQKVNLSLQAGLELVRSQKLALPQAEGLITHRPRGVLAVLGPFNFPLHLPVGHIVPALLTGNTVVFKASDKTASSAQLLTELIEAAALPCGVFNLLQGAGDVGQALAVHPDVAGVLFTGSYAVGKKIKQATLHQAHKILALEMGGQNLALVWKDADIAHAAQHCVRGAFLTAGQRCSATRRIVLHPSVAGEFLEDFLAQIKNIKIGPWYDEVFMGPVISKDAAQLCEHARTMAQKEGAKLLLQLPLPELPEGHYVPPQVLEAPLDLNSRFQNTEVFGPLVCVHISDAWNDVMQAIRATGYGLAFSIFTKERQLFQKALLEAKVGVLNWNRGTVGASGQMPFGGCGKSGNDRPTGLWASYYCTEPVASMLEPQVVDVPPMPGLL